MYCELNEIKKKKKSSTQVSAMKGFHINDLSILISVHVNCIDSIYADLGGLVVQYLER